MLRAAGGRVRLHWRAIALSGFKRSYALRGVSGSDAAELAATLHTPIGCALELIARAPRSRTYMHRMAMNDEPALAELIDDLRDQLEQAGLVGSYLVRTSPPVRRSA
ncbi:hypothetical protein [Nesterenkonia pannonica]|uniref:hypothetical protein n=1 Tax=Nesterenkonia pannonica TaxID=1548602 RepID=UPI002164A8D0|nr:hypothetical protein [Nesterenkonia pannonica]